MKRYIGDFSLIWWCATVTIKDFSCSFCSNLVSSLYVLQVFIAIDILGLEQGCATGGPRATTRPAKTFSVAIANTLIFPTLSHFSHTFWFIVYMKKLHFCVAQPDVWSWLYGPPTKNVAHPWSRVIVDLLAKR